jgi:hypothetical protein
MESPVGLGLRAEALLVTTRWTATSGGKVDSQWRSRFGGSLGGEINLPLRPSFGVSASGAARVFAPAVNIIVENQELGRLGPWGFEAGLNFWIRL